MAEKDTLEEIKRLLVVLLMKLGATSDEIAVALEVNSSRVRQMFPARKFKKIVKGTEE